MNNNAKAELIVATASAAILIGFVALEELDKKLAKKQANKLAETLSNELNKYEEGTQFIEVNMKDLFSKAGMRFSSKKKKSKLLNHVSKFIADETNYATVADTKNQTLNLFYVGA